MTQTLQETSVNRVGSFDDFSAEHGLVGEMAIAAHSLALEGLRDSLAKERRITRDQLHAMDFTQPENS